MTLHSLPSVVHEDSGLGFGCMGMTAFMGDKMKDEDAMELLKSVYDSGTRHFDTAEIYKTGDAMKDDDEDTYNETVIGKFLQTVPRDEYTVATKFMPPKWGGKSDYDTVKRALTNSLKRLGLDYVDLYYSHRIMSLEGAMEFGKSCMKLKEEGLLKNVGISEVRGSYLRKVHEICPITAVQQEWSLLTRNLEEELVPTCSELGITIVAYSPLSRNLTTFDAKPTAFRRSIPRFQGEAYEKNIKVISETLTPLTEKYGCSAAQLSLAWLFAKAKQLNVKVLPIPGTTKIKNALSNAEATKINISDDADIEKLDTLSAKIEGARGPEWYISAGIESQKD